MNKPVNQYILGIASAFLGAVLCLYLMPTTANAQRVGPFTLTAHSNITANVGIFRVDQSNGRVSFCIVDDRSLATRCGEASE